MISPSQASPTADAVEGTAAFDGFPCVACPDCDGCAALIDGEVYCENCAEAALDAMVVAIDRLADRWGKPAARKYHGRLMDEACRLHQLSIPVKVPHHA